MITLTGLLAGVFTSTFNTNLNTYFLPLVGITEFFSDMSFIIKIFLLVALIGFVSSHIENKIVKVVIGLFMAYVILFVDWSTFGTIYMIYALLGLGISGIFVDFFFISGMSGGQREGHGQTKIPGMPTEIGSGPPRRMG